MGFDGRLHPFALAVGLAVPVPASASYVCSRIDAPGSSWTNVWRINDQNQVVGATENGAVVYTDGEWAPLPPPPPESGYGAADLTGLGINDVGAVVGPATSATTGKAQGFILSGGEYSFFSYLPETYLYTEPRAISNSGLVSGWSYSEYYGRAFVYNPGAAGDYAAGITEILPTIPGGPAADRTIPGAINDAGQLVGSADFPSRIGRYALLYDPRWQEHGYSQLITLFRVNGVYTAARGINDNGAIAGFTKDEAGKIVGFVMTAGGYELITCPELGPSQQIYIQGINDNGVVSGGFVDALGGQHGVMAFPDVVLPVTSVGGAFVFDTAVSPNTPVYLDPEVAVGYRYAVGEGNPRFATVTLPIGMGDGFLLVLVGGRAFTIAGGQTFSFAANGFAGGVGGFDIMGIEASVGLDPANPRAFVTEVTFAAAGRFTGTMQPLGVGGELAHLLAAATGAGPGKSLAGKVRAAQSALAAGRTAALCDVLGSFLNEAAAQSGKQLTEATALALGAEARAVMDAGGCP